MASTMQHTAPSVALLGLEPFRALMDLARSALSDDSALPAGNGEPVLVIPGLATNQLATCLLRRRLTALNYQVEDWGQGLNTGPVDEDLDGWLAPVLERLEQMHRQHGKKVVLVGWSLGGIAARELARMAPHLVRKVVTLGTPFSGMEGSTNAGWAYELLNGGKKATVSEQLAARLRSEPPVPTVSVYSRTDGVVSWTACQQMDGRRTRHVEVEGVSHFGLVANNEVLAVLAQELQDKPSRRGTKVGLVRRTRLAS